MAMPVLPQKIILRNKTGISLNDRFSQIDNTTAAVRVQVSTRQKANAKKQRFARQMANRQLVVPANANKQQMQQTNQQPRQSALLRLGFAVRGRGQARGAPWRGSRRGAGATRSNAQYRGQQAVTRGRRGWRGRGAAMYTLAQTTTNTSYFRGRGFGRGGRGRNLGVMGGSRGYYGNVRGQRGGWGRRRGRGWRRGGQTATREVLDRQLDQYMTSTE